jgi:hypothetical protein
VLYNVVDEEYFLSSCGEGILLKRFNSMMILLIRSTSESEQKERKKERI